MHTATAKQTYRNIVAERLVAIDFEKESTNSLMRASVLLQYGVTSMCSCFLVCTNGPKCGVKFGEWMKTRKLKKKKTCLFQALGIDDHQHQKVIAIEAEVIICLFRYCGCFSNCAEGPIPNVVGMVTNGLVPALRTHTQRIGRESMNYIIYYSLVHAQLVSHIFSSPTFTFCSNTIHMSRFASFISTMAAPI